MDLVPRPRDVDLDRPSSARVYDFLLGGTNNFAPDRDLAGQMEKAHPGMRALARENRAFVVKAVRWVAAMRQVRQFIDAGCGLPAIPSVHQAAREGGGLASVAYVDNDPVVLSHVRAEAETAGPGIAVADADVSDPAAVLKDERLLDVTDLTRPVAVVFGGTLSTMPAETARNAVTGFAEALVPGSCVIVSCAWYRDQALGERMAAMYGPAAGEWHNHSQQDVTGFLEGLRIVRGKVGSVHAWPLLCDSGDREALVIGGIGLKP